MYSETSDICLLWLLSRCLVWNVSRGPILSISVDFFCTSELFLIYRPNSSEVSLLYAQTGGFFGISLSLVPLFLSVKKIEIISYGQTWDWIDVPGSLVPAFGYFRLVTNKVSWDGLITLTTGLFGWPSFLCSVIKERLL